MNASKAPWHYLLLLILAGECVFILPFVLSRVFRPTVLQVLELDNFQLGLCFSVYGIVALVSYLFGGPIADRFPPRKLIAVALWMTAVGGFFYASFPDFRTLQIIYGYWGFTTIFLFWAPMIKATRIWGGQSSQGKAFGFLDGGRGLVGAIIGTLGVIIFALLITSGQGEPSLKESSQAFRQVVLVCTGIIVVVGLLVWFFLKLDKGEDKVNVDRITISQIREVLRLPSVWLLMIIILCAYVGYKMTDDLSLYASEVMGYDQVRSAQVGTFLLYIRPVIGVLIGIIADRTKTTFWLLISFVLATLGSLLFASGIIISSRSLLFMLSIFILASGVYAARALYFAVMEKGNIPIALTGTAVGLISLVGYTPDIFASPAMGYLLEQNKGIVGHQHVFWMLSIFSVVGGIASWYYYRLYGKK